MSESISSRYITNNFHTYYLKNVKIILNRTAKTDKPNITIKI